MSLERLRAELRRLQRWVYQVLLGSHLIPPLTVFLIVALGLRKRVSWLVPGCWQAGHERPDEVCLAGEALGEPVQALAAVLLVFLEQAATAAAADPRARCARRPYRRLKAMAEAIGLHIERSRGGRWLRAIPSRDLRHRIETEFQPDWAAFAAVREAPRGPARPKPPRWRCACPRPTWRGIRRVHFQARCETCGATFTRVDPWLPPRLTPDPLAPVRVEGERAGPVSLPSPPPALRVQSPAAGVEPGVGLDSIYAECRKVFRYARQRVPPPPVVPHDPQFVIQPQGQRKTATWFVPASWHGAGPPRPEVGIAAEALGEPWRVVAGLLHEFTHWANLAAQTPDVHVRRNYHRAAFRDTAESIGLLVEKDGGRGWGRTRLSPQLRQDLEAVVNVGAFRAFRQAPPSPPGLPRWECACPIRLRGMRLAIHCHDCQTDFAPTPTPAAEATSLASLSMNARTPVHPHARPFLPLSNRPPPPAPVAP